LKKDPYLISVSTIKEPPTTLIGKLKFLGPGFILSASIVGSGELIATTVLGAKAGFAALWIIIVSCLVKVAVQLEFGKHTILTGETVMQAFNKLPGPSLGKGRWAVWIIFFLVTLKIVQVGGMLGGTVIILNMLYSGFSISTWAILIALLVSALVFNGNYSIVEKASLVMIAMFTILTMTSLYFVRYTPYAFSLTDIFEGLKFNLSADVVGVAIGAFGITGVASDEIIAYNYWCLEKGYAAYTGPREDSPEWKNRARGWINTMHLDALTAMVIYTLVTVTFYLLGSAILFSRGEIPEGNEVIETLALIYTQSLGPDVKNIYLIGAFFVLFSSVYATLAFWTRLFPDIFGQIGWIDFFNVAQRKKMIAILSWTFPFAWAAMYLFIELPVLMVLSGGVIGSFMLILVVFAAYYFKYKRTQIVKSGLFYDTAFWISVMTIFAVGVYGIFKVSF
jgi:Mn2+/Fe2+ NRAMP family transporter